MEKKYLFFDMDDTLIKCSEYFYYVEDTVANKLLEYKISYDFKQLKTMFNDKQIENLKEHGYGPDNFKYSLCQIASEVLGDDFYKDNIEQFIAETAQILYDSPLELIEGVEDTIKYLYEKGYEMYIITKGVEKVQVDRVNRLPIRECFKDYYVVKHKLQEDYETILKNNEFNPKDCYMVGNSPKGDINEAKRAGLNTIYVPNANTWNEEDTTIIDVGPKTFEVNVFSDIKNIF